MQTTEIQASTRSSRAWPIYEHAGAMLVLGIAGITAIDVVGRYFLVQPVKGSFDLIEVLMAVSVFWFMPLVSRDDNHISVGLLRTRPGSALDGLRRGLIELCCVLASAIVAWQLMRSALRSISQAEVSLIIGIPKGPVVMVCAVISLLMMLAHLYRLLAMWRAHKTGAP